MSGRGVYTFKSGDRYEGKKRIKCIKKWFNLFQIIHTFNKGDFIEVLSFLLQVFILIVHANERLPIN
jgi:hypothetical protein